MLEVVRFLVVNRVVPCRISTPAVEMEWKWVRTRNVPGIWQPTIGELCDEAESITEARTEG
jgi:hypothetical protein